MADDDEVLPDDEIEIGDGTEGEGAEGQDTGAGDEDSEVSAVSPDAPSEGDDGPQDGQPQGDGKPLSRGANRVQRAVEERNALREELAQIRRDKGPDRAPPAQHEQ